MYVQLLGFLLFASQIILNGSSVIRESNDSVAIETWTTAQPAILPEGYVRFSNIHTAYKLYEGNATWYEARDQCVAEGAQLAIANSVKKIEHITSLRTAPSYKWIHVGFYHSNATNEWVRVDNDLPAGSIPWLKDNPDGTGDCVGIVHFDSALVDYQCDYADFYFACEIPI